MHDLLIEDLERMHLKLVVEAAQHQNDPEAAKRLGFLVAEAQDTLDKARRLHPDTGVL